MSRLSQVLAGMGETMVWEERLYKDLHAHPELGYQEHATAARVAELLRARGFEVLEGVGGTGVVGVLRNGEGQTVLARADMDALPVEEQTGLAYASCVTAVDRDGVVVPVMHACGHDVHVACLLGAADLLSRRRDAWSGTMIALFQPAEEFISGAQAMLDDDLANRIPRPDAVLAQHVLALPAGVVATRSGVCLAANDSLRITLYGRGAHASAPHLSVDAVVLAAHVVLRLQTIVSRETRPGEAAVITVGGLSAGCAGNVIPEKATLLVDVRTYDDEVRRRVLQAIERIVRAECAASDSPRPPVIESYRRCDALHNDAQVTATVAAAFKRHFGARALELQPQTFGEDFGVLADGLGAASTYWVLGGMDGEAYALASAEGTLDQVPSLHSPQWAPVPQPTLTAGTEAIAVAALAFLGPD